MKYFSLFVRLLGTVFLLYAPLFASSMSNSEPLYDKVYRTDRIADSHHFFLVSKNGNYYYVHTNKTSKLSAAEIKSPDIINILNQKQSWGQAFPSHGQYTKKDGKIYTKRYWDQIKVLDSKKIKYLNKLFKLQ